MAAEFSATKPYSLAQGAYSTVDFLLDRAYARDPRLTILLNTEALSVATDLGGELPSLMVRSSADGVLYHLFSKKIILCAGTLGTARIALNSGLQNTLPLVGKGLTDHDFWSVRFLKPKNDKVKDPMRFQSRLLMKNHDDGESPDALLNVAINTNTFLRRRPCKTQHLQKDGSLVSNIVAAVDPDKYDTISVMIENQAELADKNEVLNIPTPEPIVHIHSTNPNREQHEARQKEMQDLATQIRNKLLNVKTCEPAPRLSKEGFGAVAHEVGTMRVQGPRFEKDYVVNEDLQVRGFTDLYVCDLSIFPFSSPANPSLTLAGIALWRGESVSSIGSGDDAA